MKHGFIGFGSMAQAIHKGLKKNIKNSFCYISKSNKHKQIKSANSLKELVEKSEVLWICTKPSVVEQIILELKELDLENKLIISVVAGVKIGFFEEFLGKKVKIVRIMPNLAVSYGESVIAFCANARGDRKINYIKKELENMGIVACIDEDKFDIFTAVYGSGPAFILEVIKVFKSKSSELDLDEQKINQMIVGLLKGTTSYLENNLESSSIEKLVAKITSKGGTTEAGLVRFKQNKIDKLFEEVLDDAKFKSKELSEFSKKQK